MKISHDAFVRICICASIVSIGFIGSIGAAYYYEPPIGAAVAKPSASIAPVAINNNLRYLGTAEASIICTSPFNLKEARHARYDEKWLNSLNCVRAKSGLPARIIEYASDTGYLGYKIRVTLPNGEGATVWTDDIPVDYCGDSPCPKEVPRMAPDIRRAPAAQKPETGTTARWVCQKTTIVNRSGSSPTTCGFQTLPAENVK